MKNQTMKTCSVALAILTIVFSIAWPVFAAPPPPGLLDPLTVPKFVNQLTGPPPVYVPENVTSDGTLIRQDYTISMDLFKQQILPNNPALGINFPETWTWGYAGNATDLITGAWLGYLQSSPGATFETIRGVPIQVTWKNNITSPQMFAVDPTLHWANPNEISMSELMMYVQQGIFPPFPPGFDGSNYLNLNPGNFNAQYPVPLIPHLHGGEVQSTSDGHPEAWFTHNGLNGSAYNTAVPTTLGSAVFYYPNEQPPATLWYHDHALGITRINVASGLAGFYLLRDYNATRDAVAQLLPSGKYEMPLVIQDRIFDTTGQFYFPSVGINPTDHPYWLPEFFGNTIMVNGKVWPKMYVDKGWYRFRLLDGSNARFYTLSFWDTVLGVRIPFYQIGSDGGYLTAPSPPLKEITIAPGERADILVDFSNVANPILLKNTARAPFPKGAPADPNTVGQIMQFIVTGNSGFQQGAQLPALLPTPLNPTLWDWVNNVPKFPTLPTTTIQRILTLIEVMGPGGPLEILLNGQKWGAPISENVAKGTVEEWVIVNPTADTHPIHLHLVQFQLISRQSFQVTKYLTEWMARNGKTWIGPPYPPTVWPADYNLDLAPYLQGKPTVAPPNEQGWKDTIQVNRGEVTIIRVRFAPIDPGYNPVYPFNVTQGPGYVWHCHILDHEDNEMMRPYKVAP